MKEIKYVFRNNFMPNPNSLVLYRITKDDTEINTICAVLDVVNDEMILMRLDGNATYKVNKNDNWMKLDVYDLKSLREVYNLTILETKNNGLPKEVENEKDNKNKIIKLVTSKYNKFVDKLKMI